MNDAGDTPRRALGGRAAKGSHGSRLTFALEHEGEDVRRVLRLQRHLVRVPRALENLGDVGHGEADREVAIAPVVVEPVAADQHRAQGDVARVHRLHRDARLRAV